MFEGQYLFRGNTFFSPWMPRRGDNILITCDLLAQAGTVTLDVEVHEKNTEDPGDGAVIGTALNVSATGRASKEFTGVMELVRYRFSCAGGSAATEYVVFRMLSAVWFDDVRA